MKTIFITVSRGGIIRNMFHTGVVSRLLESGFHVVVLTPYYKMPELFSSFAHKNLILEPLHWDQKEKFRRFFKELYKGAVFNSSVYARYRYSIGTPQNPSTVLFPLRMIFFAPLRYVPFAKWIIRAVHSFINPLLAHDYLFEKYKPDLVFNTAAGGDCGVIESARRFGVITVDMPKTWDNVSQALFSSKADFLIVWNNFMREKAITLQGYSDTEIIVTGIPQFDFYARKEGLLSREDFCKKHNFDPKKKIILYGSAGAKLFDESKHVLLIRKFMDEGKLAEANILIRPHLGYKGDAERFLSLRGQKGMAVDTSDKQNHALRDHYDTSIEHVYNLFNSLYHADVCVNVASTLSLDAIACGTPVVNFNFDVTATPESASVKRLFISDYVRHLMESRGTWLARSEEEFLKFLKNILEENQQRDVQNMISQFIYKLDGKSAERINEFLTGILNAKSKTQNLK
ncbi:MAG: CDP-glycerol glycerophosphotransferase family protein [Parcubacteria group bacterium]|nr:CDP-glycerol glycerophosphotransferase family protein [Parcubacteria group bacterium]